MQAKVAAWRIQRDLRRHLRVAQQMPEAWRRWMAPDIQERVRVLMIGRTVDGSLPIAWLEKQFAAERAQLHLGRLDFASPYSEPRYLRAAILEAWTKLLIYEARGAIAPKRVSAVEEEIRSAFLFS